MTVPRLLTWTGLRSGVVASSLLFQRLSSFVPKTSTSTMIAPHQDQQYSQQQQQQAAPSPSSIVPFFNGVNQHYPGLQQFHGNPPVFGVYDFLTPQECQFLIDSASDSFSPAPVVGKGAGEVSPTRTSSTCYLAREDLPNLMRKVSLLTGKPIEHMELPQVGRYLPSQQYYQHFDAFNLDEEDGRRFAANGGQRTVTVLIYLNDVDRGGQTSFPSLQLEVRPVRGMALIFFPATVDGALDRRALHSALPAVDPKYVSQIWIRQGNYYGQPSKRLDHIMGPPLGPEEVNGVINTTAISHGGTFAAPSGAGNPSHLQAPPPGHPSY